MSEINPLIAEIKQSTDYQINKRILREKILTDLHVTYNNGMFQVTTDLLSFLATWPSEQLYLEDVYHNPIEIQRDELLTLCRDHYQRVMNTWHTQHNELKQLRKI